MNALMRVAEDDQGDVIVLVNWEGFDAEGRTWESLRKIHSSAPDFVLKKLRNLRLTRALKGKLASEYRISLWSHAISSWLVVKLVRVTPKQALGVP